MLQMDRSSDTRPHKYERDRTQILNAEAWVLGFDMKIVRPEAILPHRQTWP